MTCVGGGWEDNLPIVINCVRVALSAGSGYLRRAIAGQADKAAYGPDSNCYCGPTKWEVVGREMVVIGVMPHETRHHWTNLVCLWN